MHDPGSTGTTDLQSHSLLRKSGTALCSTHEWNHKINVVVRGTIQVLLNTDVGGGGWDVKFSGKKRYEGVRFNLISVMRG